MSFDKSRGNTLRHQSGSPNALTSATNGESKRRPFSNPATSNEKYEYYMDRSGHRDQSRLPTCVAKGVVKYSAGGRPFDPNLDMTGNRYHRNVCYSPPNLRGRSLNVAEEVERGKLIALSRAETDYENARSPSQPTKQAGCKVSRGTLHTGSSSRRGRLSDSMTEAARGSKSNICIPRLSDDWRSKDVRLLKPNNTRAASCPSPLPSSRHSPPTYISLTPDRVRMIQTHDSGNNKTASRSQRGMPHQYYSLLPGRMTKTPAMTTSRAVLPDIMHANTSITGDKTPFNHATPLGEFDSPIPLNIRDLPSNHLQSQFEIPTAHQKTAVDVADLTFDDPQAESTHYQDNNDLKDSPRRYIADMPQRQISPHHTLNSMQPQIQQASISGQELQFVPQYMRQPLTIETEYARDSAEIEIDEPSAVEVDECTYPNYETSQRHLQSASSDFHSETQTKSNSNNKSPEHIHGFAYDTSAYKDSPTSFKPSRESQSHCTETFPASDCAPCPHVTPTSTLFRCLANKLSSTFYYLFSFVMPQKPPETITKAVEPDQTFLHETPAKACTPQASTMPCGRDSFWMIQRSPVHGGTSRLFVSQGNGDHFERCQMCNPSRNPDVPHSVRECCNAKKCGRVQFDSTTKCELESHRRAHILKLELENLVEDTYCPGLIQATIDGIENFNDISLNLTLGNWSSSTFAGAYKEQPPQDPMTLLEAFAIRIDKERNEALPEDSPEVEIKQNIENYFTAKNSTDLNESLKSFLLCEVLVEHDRNEKPRALSFTADLQKNATKISAYDPEIIFVAYIGHTKPVDSPE